MKGTEVWIYSTFNLNFLKSINKPISFFLMPNFLIRASIVFKMNWINWKTTLSDKMMENSGKLESRIHGIF